MTILAFFIGSLAGSLAAWFLAFRLGRDAGLREGILAGVKEGIAVGARTASAAAAELDWEIATQLGIQTEWLEASVIICERQAKQSRRIGHA